MTIKKFTELTDDEINTISHDVLRVAYRELRKHHIAETTQLREKLQTAWNALVNAKRTSHLRRYVKADPPPIYDEIFREGTAALDADVAGPRSILGDGVVFERVDQGLVRVPCGHPLSQPWPACEHCQRGDDGHVRITPMVVCPQTGRQDCPGDHHYPCNCVCHGTAGWSGGGDM